MTLDTELQKGSAQIRQVETVRIWILTDNYYDALRPDHAVAKRYRVRPGESIHAEHGLAYFVETVVDGQTSTCVFDFGLDPRGIINNARLLKIDLGSADAFILSHGHFDHWGGLFSLLKDNKDKIKKGVPFYVGEEAFSRRFADMPPGTFDPVSGLVDLGSLDRKELEALEQVKVVEVGDQAHRFLPGVRAR